MALGCLRKYKEEIECYKKAPEINPEYKELKEFQLILISIFAMIFRLSNLK
ncbi:unnamed protein product [marine sediment metagenome]|uniref:Uncharacterized protein n=1 Tax=marine sediment metagenome TaxID=412755 RepID=X1CED4_9ZZZZ